MATLADVTEMIYGQPAKLMEQHGGESAVEYVALHETMYRLIGDRLSSSIGSDDPVVSPREQIGRDAERIYDAMTKLVTETLGEDWLPHACHRSNGTTFVNEMALISLGSAALSANRVSDWQRAAARLVQIVEGSGLTRRSKAELVGLISKANEPCGVPQAWRHEIWPNLRDAWHRERGTESFARCAEEIVALIPA